MSDAPTRAVQRIDDLLAVVENKEIKQLANIVKDYIKDEKKVIIGFHQDMKEVKKELEDD